MITDDDDDDDDDDYDYESIVLRSFSLSEAAGMLQTELGYQRARAEHFAKQFDKNNDGQLCAAEFDSFRNTIRDT